MYVFCVVMYMCTQVASGHSSLVLELQEVVKHLKLELGTKFESSGRAPCALNH